MEYIDINCDMGEGFGDYSAGDDTGMLSLVTTANVACGFHAGDPHIMFNLARKAKEAGVAIGAHPGYPDLWGFGRRPMTYSPQELKALLVYQIGAFDAAAKLAGHKMTHVKVHGAMGHLVHREDWAARALIEVIQTLDENIILSTMVKTILSDMAVAEGLRVVHEVYADRAYDPAGQLVSRGIPGAVIHDSEAAAQNVLRMLSEQAVFTVEGVKIPLKQIDSVCVHSDTAGAVEMTAGLVARLKDEGIALRPYADMFG